VVVSRYGVLEVMANSSVWVYYRPSDLS
jgi:hypothetical protein